MVEQKTKIMVFGTFDVIHKGHLHFFKQARKLSRRPFLIVSVSRDANAKKIKGQMPLHNEKYRLKNVANCPLVNKAILGGAKSYLPHIIKEKPQIIGLGYDQSAYVGGLRAKLLQSGVKVKIARLRPFKQKIYKTSLLKTKI
jgi:FAD synthetase